MEKASSTQSQNGHSSHTKRLRTDETTQWTRSRSISEIRAALLEAVLNYVSTATGPDLEELASRLPLCDEKIEATYERK